MNDTISVIVPVYNVATYLPQCLESILNQDYLPLEVILINDGSTDISGEICDDYAQKDPRVKVIHQKNSGAAAAKNAGLRAATGKYLSFVDSDDYLESGAYSHMIGMLCTHDADVVQCAHRDVYKGRTVDRLHKHNIQTHETLAYMKLYTTDWTCGLLWDKLYLRSIFDGVFFEEGHKIDDEYFTYRGIMNANKVVRDNFIVYNYRKRRSSVMYSPESGKQILLDRVDYLSKRRKNIIARFPELRDPFDRHFVDMMVILSHDPLATKDSCLIIRKQLAQYIGEKSHTPIDIRLWPALVKIWFGPRKNAKQPTSSIDINRFFD